MHPAHFCSQSRSPSAWARRASAHAAGTIALTGPSEGVAGSSISLTADITTDQPASVHLFDEQGFVACGATPAEQAARPASQRVGGDFAFPPGGSRPYEIYTSAPGPHTVCAYLSSADDASPPDGVASHAYTARAPRASLRLAAPSRFDASAGGGFTITASGDTEAAAALNVLAQRGGGSCASTAAQQQEREGSSFLIGDFVEPGPFTRSESAYLAAGDWTLCAYLSGTRDGPPHATASAALVSVGGEPVEDPGEDIGGGRPSYGSAFGSSPIPLSVGRGGAAANGPSGGGALSGDNRKTRLAAFHSDASNLVRGDSNKTTDVFVWQRPRRRSRSTSRGPRARSGAPAWAWRPPGERAVHAPVARRLAHPQAALRGVPVACLEPRSGRPRQAIRCVRARPQRAQDLPGLARHPAAGHVPVHRRRLLPRGVRGRRQVRVAPVRGGRVRSMGRGSQPDFSLDGSALVWVRGGNVWIDRLGRRSRVGPGGKPRVSDNESGIWGIVFNTRRRLTGKDRNSSQDVYTRVVKRSGGPSRTDLISAPGKGSRSFGEPASNGGITAYGANRGIITFTAGQNAGATLFYRNNNTGNIDNLADTFAGGRELYLRRRHERARQLRRLQLPPAPIELRPLRRHGRLFQAPDRRRAVLAGRLIGQDERGPARKALEDHLRRDLRRLRRVLPRRRALRLRHPEERHRRAGHGHELPRQRDAEGGHQDDLHRDLVDRTASSRRRHGPRGRGEPRATSGNGSTSGSGGRPRTSSRCASPTSCSRSVLRSRCSGFASSGRASSSPGRRQQVIGHRS